MATQSDLPLYIEDIYKIIPHRYPFLMVDRVDIIEPGERIVGVKNVSINEGFFQGHFPERPVMPGVLLLECMAQLGAIYVNYLGEAATGTLVVFTGIDDVKFRRQVVPGDTLRIELTSYRRKMIHFKMKGGVYVGDELACSASVSAAMVPWKE